MATLETAIAIATEAHAGQVDKAGAPYIAHPLRVAECVEGETVKIVAVLHDVIEDSPAWSFDRLRAVGFGDDVLAALDGVTRRQGESYDAFIDRAAQNPIAKRVKIADLLDNSDLSRIAAPQTADLERLEKYRRALETLQAM